MAQTSLPTSLTDTAEGCGLVSTLFLEKLDRDFMGLSGMLVDTVVPRHKNLAGPRFMYVDTDMNNGSVRLLTFSNTETFDKANVYLLEKTKVESAYKEGRQIILEVADSKPIASGQGVVDYLRERYPLAFGDER